MTNEQLERQIIELVAADRFFVTTSSMDNKLKRMRKTLVSEVGFAGRAYSGERVYARVVDEEGRKARGMAQGINEFCERHPNYGSELKGLIAEQRIVREPTMYFGVQEGCRLTADDYLGVMGNLGFSEGQARSLYEPLINISRKLSRARTEERSILIG